MNRSLPTRLRSPKRIILLIGTLFTLNQAHSQVSYTWTGATSSSWNVASNWSPAGIPGSIDNATIVTTANSPQLTANTTISGLKVTSGTLDLGGFTLTASGPTSQTFSTGTVQNGTLNITTASNVTFGNGPMTMNCIVTVVSAGVTLRNTTFQKVTTITKNGSSNDASPGGNTFNAAVTFNNLGSGYLLLGNGSPDVFNAASTFNNTGSANLQVAYNSTNNIFNGVATFNNAPTTSNYVYVSQNSTGTQFNDNIVVTSVSGNGVSFCSGNSTATATLAAGKTITIGGAGFSAGTLQLRQFTQVGATAQNLTLTGTGNMTFGPSSSFGGDVTATSPTMYLHGCYFDKTSNFTKTGSSGDWSNGGNTFNGNATFTNSGSSYFLLGSNSPDTWNSDATFIDNGSERMLPCWSTAGNLFKGNIYVSSSGSASGIQFCGGNNSATATLANGKTILPISGGITAGYLYLKGFIQTGSTPLNLNVTGTGAVYLGPYSSFDAPVTVTSPDIWVQGATYNSPVVFTKTGGQYNHNNQYQNIFNSTVAINQQSSTGYFMLGYNSNDLFNDDITVTSTGSGGIYLGWQSGTGTPTQAAGKTILVGGAGFSAGFLSLNTYTQLGSAPMNLNFTGASTRLVFARSSVIGGDVTSNTPDVYFNGSTFNGIVNVTKTGASNNGSNGGNTFNKVLTINNTGTGYVIMGNGNADTCNADVYLNSSGGERIAMAWSSSGNMFNGDIIATSTGSSSGIQFGNSSGASAILAAGKTISIGGAGFNSGQLLLRQFTQLGTTPINLTLTGATTLLQIGNSSAFGGSFTAVSPRILLNGAVFNDVASFTKTGVTGEWSYGGNTFNGVTTINHQGGGYFGFANGAPDIYNADLYVNNNSTERIIFGNNPVGNQFNGNIILTQIGSSVGTAFGWSSNTDETQAAGKTISIGGAGFNTGYLQIMRFTQLGSAAVNLPLSGSASLQFGPSSALGGNVTAVAPTLYFNGCTFSGTVDATKNGSTNDWSSGNNIFNGVTTMTNSGSGYLLFGNGNSDQFNTNATFNNTGSANLYVAYNSTNNIFGGVTTFNNSPTTNALIYVSPNSAGTVFNDNIIVTSTNGSGVQFDAGNSTATTTLAAGKNITVGAAGFSAGTLMLRAFTQLGNAPSTLTLTGTSNLTYGPNSAFGGDMTSSSPTLYLQGAVFGGRTDITKTGTTGDYSYGGNTFNGPSTITNTGSSFLLLGNSNPDIWNDDVTFIDNGSERILPAWNSAGNQFNGNIYVNTAGTAQGIAFCNGSSTATATLAAGKTIQTGTIGLKSGYLILRQFTQLGNAPINLTLSSTATYLQYGPSSSLGGDVTSSSPGMYFNGCIFGGTATCVKTGTSNDQSNGNNIFNGVTVITNTGSGNLSLGNGNRDQFITTATFNNFGANNMNVAQNSSNNTFGGVTTFNNATSTNNSIYVSQNSSGTVFNDNVVVTSASGSGIIFCAGNTTANAVIVGGKTISIGSAGFSSGILLLRQFQQLGTVPVNLTLTGTGNLTFGPTSAIGGNLTSVSPTLYFNGCTFNGTLTSTKNGTSSDQSNGNNVFNGASTITNTGSGYLIMGNNNPDTWNSTAVFNNNSSGSHMYTAYNSTGNVFNGDVTFNNQPGATGLYIYVNNSGINTQFNGNITVSNVSGGGVYFGNGSGSATLASGKTVSVGSAGFNSGNLIFRNFKQTGGSSSTITTTGTSTIQFGPNSNWDGTIISTSPALLFTTSTFNGTVQSTKTGSTNDQSPGTNVFYGTTTLTNTGTGYLMMSNSALDIYNGNISFVQTGTGAIYPNYNAPSTYAGNVTVTSPSSSAITFGNGSGSATFNGSTAQMINATGGTPTPVFSRLIIANTGGDVTLSNTSINVSKTLTMTSGLLNTSATYLLTMLNASTTSAGTALSTSYVNGPMRYQKSTSGSTTLNFPVGKNGDCRPVVLVVNHTNSTLYNYTTQVYKASARGLGWQLPPTVDWVSDFHYWTIVRTNASGTEVPKTDLSGNQAVTLHYGTNDAVTDGISLTVCKNTYTAMTTWIDIGGNGGPAYTGANLVGSVTSTSTPTAFNSFSTFTIGNVHGGSSTLPVELLYFRATPNNDVTDLSWATASEYNNSYFTIERSQDGVGFAPLQKVASKAVNGISRTTLNYAAQDAAPFAGTNYYRLKQTNLDGTFSYSAVVTVSFDKRSALSVYPNPTRGAVYVKGINVDQTSIKADWYDLGGRLIAQETAAASYGTAQLNPHFNNGVYVLKITTADGTVKVQNIIIMK